jgi:hypothetical protein
MLGALTAVAATGWSRDARLLARDDHAIRIAPYEYGLNRVVPKCRETRHKVAAEVWATKGVLRQDGYREKNLTLLRALNRSIPPSLGRTNCGQVLAALVVLIEKG